MSESIGEDVDRCHHGVSFDEFCEECDEEEKDAEVPEV